MADFTTEQIALAIDAARDGALVEVLARVNAEPELPGACPTEAMMAFAANPEESMRSAVRVTKRNIAAAIEALRKDGKS